MLCPPVGWLQFGTPWCQASVWIVTGTCWSLLDPCLAHPAVTSPPASAARTALSAPVPTYRAGLCQLCSLPRACLAAGRLLWLTGESWALTNPLSNVFCRVNMIATNGRAAGKKGKRKRKKACFPYRLHEVNRKWLSVDQPPYCPE